MLELSKVKQVKDIGTYHYHNNPEKNEATDTKGQVTTRKLSIPNDISGVKTSKTSVSAKNNAASASQNQENAQSFDVHLNSAAKTQSKTSNSDYSSAEWEAQRKKNLAISKLQQTDADMAALERVAPNASDDVKKAWLDAARQTHFNGLGYSQDGTGSAATRLYADLNESAKMTDNSIAGVQDLLGGTVDSAIDAVSFAKEDSINMKNSSSTALRKREVEFYDAFLSNLDGLKNGNYVPSDQTTFDLINKSSMKVLPDDNSSSSLPLTGENELVAGAIFHSSASTDENGRGFDLTARYVSNYNPQDPRIIVSTNYGGAEKSYEIAINNINTNNASQVELYGLYAYIDDDKNIPRNIDPVSSDIYYSSLDNRLASKNSSTKEESYLAETVESFKPIGNLSYWDKKELLDSIYSGS